MLAANRLPMTQEKLTQVILERFVTLTEGTCTDVAIHLKGEHGCTKIRGIRAQHADMVTEKLVGRFRTEPELTAQFRALVNGR